MTRGIATNEGEFANQRTRRFDPPGGKTARGIDWVLVLDDAPEGLSAPEK